MSTPINQEIEAQINLNWVQFWRDNELTFLMTLGDIDPHTLTEAVKGVYDTAFRGGIDEAFRQASLAAEQELKRRGGF